MRYQGRHVSARKEILLKIISIKYQYIIKKKKKKKERQVLLRNTGATSAVGTAYHFRPPECTAGFK